MKLISAISIAWLVLAAYPEPEESTNLKKLQGTWQIVALIADGNAAPAKEVEDSTMVIDGSKYVLKGKESYRGTLRLLDNQDPKGIDTTFIDDQGKEVGAAKGIYRLEGSRLHISWSEKGARPTTFESKKDSGERAITLQRGS